MPSFKYDYNDGFFQVVLVTPVVRPILATRIAYDSVRQETLENPYQVPPLDNFAALSDEDLRSAWMSLPRETRDRVVDRLNKETDEEAAVLETGAGLPWEDLRPWVFENGFFTRKERKV